MFNIVPTLEMGIQAFPGASGEVLIAHAGSLGGCNYLGVKLRFGDRPVESSSSL